MHDDDDDCWTPRSRWEIEFQKTIQIQNLEEGSQSKSSRSQIQVHSLRTQFGDVTWKEQ